jgi:hypothetical protein
MAFNLSEYEEVQSKVQRWIDAYPLGRIETSIIEFNMKDGYVLVEARCYRDDLATLPASIDYALEWRDKSTVSRLWWLENAVTSAIGRCLNQVLPSLKKASVEDMSKIERLTPEQIKAAPIDAWSIAPNIGSAVEALASELGGQLIEEAPLCNHGHMILKSGVSEKTGREYHGYTCPERTKANQCDAVWYKLDSNGKWVR